MRIDWRITKADVRAVESLLAEHCSSPPVRRRRAENLARHKPKVRKYDFWFRLVVALVTTQQKSGPGSHVHTFIHKDPFPLSYR
jgi:hypothetical protein